ncbi:leucine-rich repeat domain-containing protein [Butyrivibrio sp. AE3004]|uniref:leucine-rich repeat domain-containing protein n=1 Tax=Butyrivibrio sp. AE3004 TaxID=1506994 RepID=UPI00049471A3|nr:leucine-rich repeat domain-containing protein [Butyrivibrio sp. AE3004]
MKNKVEKNVNRLLAVCCASVLALTAGMGGITARADEPEPSPNACWLLKTGKTDTINFYTDYKLDSEYANSADAVFSLHHADTADFKGLSYDKDKDTLVMENVKIREEHTDSKYIYANMPRFFNIKGIYGKGVSEINSAITDIDFNCFNGYTNNLTIYLDPGASLKFTYQYYQDSALKSIEDKLVLGEGVKKEVKKYSKTESEDWTYYYEEYTFRRNLDIAPLKASAKLSSNSMEYTGAELKPTVTIEGLKEGTDFTVAYANNVQIGTGKITVTGMGKYEGSFDLTFEITPKTLEPTDENAANYKTAATDTPDGVEATFTGDNSKKDKSVTIPDTIKLKNGSEAKVTKVDNNACKGNKNLTSVKIGSNVNEIGENAFSGCPKLKSVTLPASVTTIRSNAFKGDKNLKTIKIYAKNLKSIGKNAFKGINSKATFKLVGTKKEKAAAAKLIKKSGTGYKKTMKIKK